VIVDAIQRLEWWRIVGSTDVARRLPGPIAPGPIESLSKELVLLLEQFVFLLESLTPRLE
jgi:hypothetical protein